MRHLKWLGLAALATGMVFQLGGCSLWELIGAALVGLALTGGLAST